MEFGASVAQSSEQAPFISLMEGLILAMDSCEESVNALPKVVGFLRALWVSPTGLVPQGGLG
jgi:hypothetical protein